MKFLTWNIMSGGFNNYSEDLKFPERIDNIIEIVKNSNADFVSLIDTFMWDIYFTTEKISKLFGYKYVYCINLEDERLKKLGHNNGITVLTNIDNPKFETIRIATRNIVKTHFNKKKSLDIFSLYLDDLSEDVRTNQIKTLHNYISNTDRSILTGDLNSLAKEDFQQTKKLIEDFYKSFPDLKRIYSQKITNLIKGDTIELIKKLGFKNASRKFIPTMPTPLLFGKNSPFLRLDYIFLGKDLKISDFKVIINNQSNIASDHYPIQFNIKF